MKMSKGYIITDHDYENVLNLADSIVYLQDGYLKKIHEKSELVELGYLTKTTYNSIYN
ncbi:MAG: ABC-type sulfate/molybdate transport systems ATPase subunit [Candidatus Paceibacteria bacterium]|jgi:ABC-type sulfate/molybdate transport systems ATPase subunit